MADIDNNTIIDLLFEKDKGPIENVCLLVEKGYMFLGWWNVVVVQVAEAMGWSLSELGRKLDEALGLSNAHDLVSADASMLDRTIESYFIPLSLKADFTESTLRSYGKGFGRVRVKAPIKPNKSKSKETVLDLEGDTPVKKDAKALFGGKSKLDILKSIFTYIKDHFNLKSGLFGLLALKGTSAIKHKIEKSDDIPEPKKKEMQSDVDVKVNMRRKALERNIQTALSGS